MISVKGVEEVPTTEFTYIFPSTYNIQLRVRCLLGRDDALANTRKKHYFYTKDYWTSVNQQQSICSYT